MNGIKLNSIEWLVPEIKTSHLDPVFFEKEQAYLDTDEKQRIFAEGFNKCLKQQGEREIYLDFKKLSGLLTLVFEVDGDRIADYLIKHQSQIIKAVKDCIFSDTFIYYWTNISMVSV